MEKSKKTKTTQADSQKNSASDHTLRTGDFSSGRFFGRYILSEFYTAHTDTSTLYFTPYFNRGAGSGDVRIGDNGGPSFVMITEIAE